MTHQDNPSFHQYFIEALHGLAILLEGYKDGQELNNEAFIQIEQAVAESITHSIEHLEEYLESCLSALAEYYTDKEYEAHIQPIEIALETQTRKLVEIISVFEANITENNPKESYPFVENISTAFYGLVASLEQLGLLMVPILEAPEKYRSGYNQLYHQIYLLSLWIEEPSPTIKHNLIQGHKNLMLAIEEFNPVSNENSESLEENIAFRGISDPTMLIEQAIIQVESHAKGQTDSVRLEKHEQDDIQDNSGELDPILKELEAELDEMITETEILFQDDNSEGWFSIQKQVQEAQFTHLDNALTSMRDSLDIERNADVHMLLLGLQNYLREWTSCLASLDNFEEKKSRALDNLLQLNSIYLGL